MEPKEKLCCKGADDKDVHKMTSQVLYTTIQEYEQCEWPSNFIIQAKIFN